jgi:hypothetical protein
VGADRVNVNGGAIALGHPIGGPGPASPCIWCTSWSGAAEASGPPGYAGTVSKVGALILRVPAPAV